MVLAHAVESKVEAAYRRGDIFEKRRKPVDASAGCCAGARPLCRLPDQFSHRFWSSAKTDAGRRAVAGLTTSFFATY